MYDSPTNRLTHHDAHIMENRMKRNVLAMLHGNVRSQWQLKIRIQTWITRGYFKLTRCGRVREVVFLSVDCFKLSLSGERIEVNNKRSSNGIRTEILLKVKVACQTDCLQIGCDAKWTSSLFSTSRKVTLGDLTAPPWM